MSRINMSNIPNQQISGLSSEFLDWVSNESGSRYVEESSSEFYNELNQIENFEEVNEDVLKILNESEKSVIPFSTEKQNKCHVGKFKNDRIVKWVDDAVQQLDNGAEWNQNSMLEGEGGECNHGL